MGFHVAWMIHIYLYAASRLWDTDRISRLRRLPLKRRAITHFGEEPSAARGRLVERVHDAGVGRRFDRAVIRRAKRVALFLRSSRKSKHVLLDSGFREGGRQPLPWDYFRVARDSV